MSRIKFTGKDKFCIKHQSMKEVCIAENHGEGHLAALFAPDWGWCEGPFATTPPPALPEGWELTIEEPGSEELFVMNVMARQLRLDLEGSLS